MLKHSFCLLFIITILIGVADSITKIPLRRKEKSPDFLPLVNFINRVPFDLNPYIININIGGNNTADMALSLFTSNTFIAKKGCEFFLPYSCEYSLHCTELTNVTSNLTLPQFSVGGSIIQVPVVFGESTDYWTDSMNITYADFCSSNPWIPIDGTNPYLGSIGLGIDNDGNTRFNSSTSFSIFIDLKNQEGELAFGTDWLKKFFNKPHIVNNATYNWEVSLTNVSINNYNFTYTGTLIFDINLPYIVVPFSLYQKILGQIRDAGYDCKQSNGQVITVAATCTYNGSQPKLGDLIFTTYNNDSISIPSSVYLQANAGQKSATLLVVPSSLNSAPNDITVTSPYQNHVILGTAFINFYYTVFDFSDMSNPKIIFYEAYDGTFNNPVAAGIGLGAILLLCTGICCGCCYYSKRKVDKRRTEQEDAFLRHTREFNMNDSKFI